MSAIEILSAMMALTMLMSTVAVNPVPDDIYTEDTGETEEISEQKLPIPDNITAGGDSIDFFIAYDIFNSDFIASDEKGDILNDAVYKRNKTVSEHFDTELNFVTHISSGSVAQSVIKTIVMAGDDTYEVFIGDHANTMPLVYDNFFVDIKTEMPHIDLENPWWNKNINDSINFGGKYCAVTGDINLHNIKSTGCLVFNKNLMKDHGLELPYKSVLEGTWTADRFIEYMKAGHRDINGDGVMLAEHDAFAYSGFIQNSVPNTYAGFNADFIVKTEDGLPSLNIMNDRTFTAIDMLIEVFNVGNGAYINAEEPSKASEMFNDSKLLFMDVTLSKLADMRQVPIELGVLPYPKLDTAQREYKSGIASYSSLLFVPQTNNKRELTSALLEYMAYLSHRDVVPSYLDLELIIKSARDIESEQMIELIANGGVFTSQSFISDKDLCTFVTTGNNSLASTYAMNSARWKKKLDGMIEFYNE